MENYYFVIYFADGSSRKSGSFNYESSAERAGAQEFQRQIDIWRSGGAQEFFKPTRYEVKRG